MLAQYFLYCCIADKDYEMLKNADYDLRLGAVGYNE
jgi:hypothetical protein